MTVLVIESIGDLQIGEIYLVNDREKDIIQIDDGWYLLRHFKILNKNESEDVK